MIVHAILHYIITMSIHQLQPQSVAQVLCRAQHHGNPTKCQMHIDAVMDWRRLQPNCETLEGQVSLHLTCCDHMLSTLVNIPVNSYFAKPA